ncbi:phosphodiesterase [bacterium]|nr:MAG: phosphodiesterase [bacterium]
MKVVVIGLDCLEPSLVFEKYSEHLPNFRRLREKGLWGRMESTIPPITIPAWASMVTGKLPGTLGFYGFRNRKDYSYEKLAFATSNYLKEKTIWDYLTERGKRSIIIGVPPSYPPKPLNGILISCFLTPSTDSPFTYPEEVKSFILEHFGDYMFDVKKFRTEDKDWLLSQVYRLTEQRFAVARYFLENEEWDFFMMVDMGPDRFHHGFWKFFDPEHVKYEPGNKYENSGIEYYKFLDEKLGEFLDAVPQGAFVFVVSDHGAKRMDGGIVVNEFLIKEGYLKLKSHPSGIFKLEEAEVDWDHTVAWGEGGYYSRIFLNVKGREPRGVIPPEDYEKVREELKQKLEEITDEEGRNIGTKVYKPEEIYPEIKNIPPDLIVLFGDLYWRAIGTMGYGTLWSRENDTGPDDANHAMHGTFIMYPVDNPHEVSLHITDVAGTILKLFDIEPEGNFYGKSII